MKRQLLLSVVLIFCLLKLPEEYLVAVEPLTSIGSDSIGQLRIIARNKLNSDSPLCHAFYVSNLGFEMIGSGGYSHDNGQSWAPLTVQPDFDTGLPKGFRREPFPGFLDPVTNNIVCFVNSLDTEGLDPTIVEPPVSLEKYYLRYRVSIDGGKNFLFDEPIVQKGEFTVKHPFKGVWVGKNAIFIGDHGSQPIRTREGRVLVPTSFCTLDSDGKLSSVNHGVTSYTNVLILIGKWIAGNRLEWEISQPISADPAHSTRGMFEPTITEMPDGRILMVMRGSNGGKNDPNFKIPGYRWYSYSDDGGIHWKKPQPWKYDDGTPFFSPSSASQLISHSNGRYYWIGNISPSNPQGNKPRWPLVIGEVNPSTLFLIKNSIITIDTLRPEDKFGVDLASHYAAFEDRKTGDIILPMRRFINGYKSHECYIYRIGT